MGGDCVVIPIRLLCCEEITSVVKSQVFMVFIMKFGINTIRLNPGNGVRMYLIISGLRQYFQQDLRDHA